MTLLTLLAACGAGPACFCDDIAWSTFPFDGARTWTFASTDPAVPHELVVTSDQEPEEVGGTRVYTLDHRRSCAGGEPGCVDGGLVRRVRWSSDVVDGVAVHGLGDAGGPIVAVDPPIRIVGDVVEAGEAVETVTAGSTWIATFVGDEPCPTSIADDWRCSLVEVATDPAEGGALAGRYWNVRGTGFVAMELASESGRWELIDFTCDGDCDGDW